MMDDHAQMVFNAMVRPLFERMTAEQIIGSGLAVMGFAANRMIGQNKFANDPENIDPAVDVIDKLYSYFKLLMAEEKSS